MMQITSYCHHSFIPWRKTNSEILVKFQQNDVTWRHMISFYDFVIKKCWRQQKWFTGGKQILVFWIHPYNSFNLRGQPLFYDKWFKSYRLLCEGLISADVSIKLVTSSKLWRHTWNFFGQNCLSYINLTPCKVSSPTCSSFKKYQGGVHIWHPPPVR